MKKRAVEPFEVFLVGRVIWNKWQLKIFVTGRSECPLSLVGWGVSEMFACGRTGVLRGLGQQITLGSWIGFFTSPCGLLCHVHPSRVTAPHHQQHPTALHASLGHPDGKLVARWAPLLPGCPPTTKQAEPAGKLKMGWEPTRQNVSVQSLLWPVQHKQNLPGCFVSKQGMSAALETTGPDSYTDISL